MRRNGLKSRLAALAMCTGLLAAPGAQADTLTDAMILAYRSSELLDQQRALLRATDEDVAQAVATLRPIITYALRSTYSDPVPLGQEEINSSAQLGAEWLLFDFGERRLRVEAQKETVLATRSALTDNEQGVLLRAVSAFMNVLRQQEFVSLRQNNVRLITQELRAAGDRFEVGEVTRTDVSLAEARLAAARSELAAAQGALAQAREEYLAVVGKRPENLVSPNGLPQLPNSVDAAKEIGVRNHPLIEQRKHQVAAAELAVSASTKQFLPRLNSTADVTLDDEGETSSQVGVSIGGSIYRGGQLASAYRQFQERENASRAELLRVVEDVRLQVGNAWADLAVALASLEASRREIDAAQLAFDGVREEVRLGARTTLDVLDAEQDLLDARARSISSDVDRFIAAYTLLSRMGLLTVDHLGLGVPTYDPAAYYNAVKGAPVTRVSPQGQRLDSVLRALGRQ